MNQEPTAPHLILDTRGMFCPAPVIVLSEAIRNIDPCRIVELVSDDPAVEADLDAWCRREGHAIVGTATDGKDSSFRVKKAGESPSTDSRGR